MPRRETETYELPLAPDAVAERLRARTRFRIMPVQARLVGRMDRPLAGRVRLDGFRVALNRRDPLTRLQAVAVGRVEPSPTGSRVTVTAGLPAWLTWYLRLASVLGTLVIAGGGAAVLTGGGQPSQAALISLALGVVLVAMTLGIGLNVSNADEQVPELLAQVRAVLDTAPPTPEDQATADARAAADRRASAARTAQRQPGS